MPNLKMINNLREKFDRLDERSREVKVFIENLDEAKSIRKAFNSGRLNEFRDVRLFTFINESINADKPEIIQYFEQGTEEEVTLMFIDITSFSKTIQGFTNAQIKTYLDNYYKEIIPIIYDCGGEIEKLMGDGIICLFGPPFLDLPIPLSVYSAERCAERLIKKFHGTNKNVKVAIHIGKVQYYKVPSEEYSEYTMVGQPITDLYRLESVSSGNAINFFSLSIYDNLGWEKSRFDVNKILFNRKQITLLQGVSYNEIKSISFPNFL